MSTVIANQTETSEQILPWYRYGWPWFLISIPFVSMMLGGLMLFLALSTNNSLVIDDYYKEGKAYNLRIERDRAASLLGLDAAVTPTSEGLVLQLALTASDEFPVSLLADAQQAQAQFVMPETIQVRWVHVTQAERDGQATLQFIGGGRYVAPGLLLPEQGKYRLHIQPLLKNSTSVEKDSTAGTASTQWRLISALTVFNENVPVDVPAPELEAVYTRSMLQ